MAGVRKWRKILYEDQGVADNYVDSSFLEELKKNLNTRTYDYPTLLVESGIITQQLSSFLYMEEKWLSPHSLVLSTSLCTLVLYIVNAKLTGEEEEEEKSQRTYVDDVKTAVLFLGVSFMLSPVLVSLTETISTDTIYAMTTVMLLANLLVPGALSLSAAIFASVCLASRLHTTWHAFATVIFSFELFALWPVLRRRLQKYFSPKGQVTMTVFITLTTVSALLSVTTVGAVLYLLAFIFITFVCPAWLISLQPYKNNIHGPWDEAEIEDELQAG
ncbi:hypothetical protein BaRGS_00004362 [Batillaria attramentaria]|uniref:Phosphatidylinositol N-acetylglucosaminyltransferase subunit C n=1 Tax=Batillaria attramentaria TaxID=370345 RepID=A0ABD0LZB5_9CAEN